MKWLTAMLRGDFGQSFLSHVPVMDLIAQRLPNTLAVVGVAYLVGVLIAIPLGLISAVKRYSMLDNVATTVAFMGFSTPTFFTGLLLIIIFSVNLRWLPFIYDSNLKITDLASLGQITGRFSGHLADKVLVHANEAIWGGNKAEEGTLKAMITDDKMAMESKGRDIVTINNYKRVIISSNEQWAVPRALRHEVGAVREEEQSRTTASATADCWRRPPSRVRSNARRL